MGIMVNKNLLLGHRKKYFFIKYFLAKNATSKYVMVRLPISLTNDTCCKYHCVDWYSFFV